MNEKAEVRREESAEESEKERTQEGGEDIVRATGENRIKKYKIPENH